MTASTMHSRSTSPVKIAAQRNRRSTPTTGRATMLPARIAQIIVRKNLIAVSLGFVAVSMLRSVSAISDNNHPLRSRRFREDCQVEE